LTSPVHWPWIHIKPILRKRNKDFLFTVRKNTFKKKNSKFQSFVWNLVFGIWYFVYYTVICYRANITTKYMMAIPSWIIYYFIIKPLSLLPLRILYLCSDLLYYIIYYLIGYRKKVVFTNLSRSFPDKSRQEIKTIARNFTVISAI